VTCIFPPHRRISRPHVTPSAHSSSHHQRIPRTVLSSLSSRYTRYACSRSAAAAAQLVCFKLSLLSSGTTFCTPTERRNDADEHEHTDGNGFVELHRAPSKGNMATSFRQGVKTAWESDTSLYFPVQNDVIFHTAALAGSSPDVRSPDDCIRTVSAKPDLRLPFHPYGFIAHQPVTNYTAWRRGAQECEQRAVESRRRQLIDRKSATVT